MSVASQVAEFQSLLDDLAKKHEVPGASLGVLVDGEIKTAVTGVTNITTQAPVSPDTLFQIGSTTKAYLATLVMQLVDEGKLELDQPAADIIEGFQFGPDEEGRQTTIRQLLAHTSGLVGDEFGDFPASDDWGRGEEAVTKFVATACPTLPRLAPAGAMMSYNNAGYITLGRIVEILRGKPFAQALKEHLLVPLGAAHSATLPEEAIMHSVAIGHSLNPENLKEPIVAPLWQLPTAYAPAGALLCASATDVLRFAQLHLNDGKTEDGTQVLSAESARLMRERQIDVPRPNILEVSGWGLGFFLFEWDGVGGFGHNGDTIGQHCEFRVFPEKGIAFVLLANGALSAFTFSDEVMNEVLQNLAGISIPLPPTQATAVEDLSPFAGTFGTPTGTLITKVQSDQLLLNYTPEGSSAALSTIPPLKDTPLMPVGDGGFVLEVLGVRISLAFYDFDDEGRARYIHLGGRAIPRTS
jgi:CubicO group peptidase (beta-lactamase class C family)